MPGIKPNLCNIAPHSRKVRGVLAGREVPLVRAGPVQTAGCRPDGPSPSSECWTRNSP